MKFGLRQKAAFGIGAVGKDMVYALSASFVMYYYQDILGLSASFVGLILMIARVFDAVNDPFMGVVVAKTKTKWGRFRPWLFSGTILNAFVLYALFATPSLEGTSLKVYFAIIYIVWGMTYTMMDIPYWSMIPAVTDNGSDRETLSVIGRTCAGVGYSIITVITLIAVNALGGGNERAGFKTFALVIAVFFVIAETICCAAIRERRLENMQTASVGEMFRSLFRNDQAMATVAFIVLINGALYLTSNLIIYFFKYDIGGETWQNTYTLFTTVGGASQILGMMVLYPVMRRKLSNTQIFRTCLTAAIVGYGLLLGFCLLHLETNILLLMIPGFLIFAANGILTVLTTIFLSNAVDYGEYQTGRREESVVFSMQTFVVKAASGVSVFLAGIGLDVIGLVGNSDTSGEIVQQSASTLTGLHLLMTILPIIGLACALLIFARKFKLNDDEAARISNELAARRGEME